MDKQDFKNRLASWDNSSRDIRADRWSEISPDALHISLPHLIWRYLSEAEDMYIYGYYIGVILLTAGTLELALGDQIASELNINERDISHFELQQLIVLGQSLGLILQNEASQLDEFRLLRNSLIHGNTGKLAQMTRKSYQSSGFRDALPVETYLSPETGNGINQDALRFLNLTRDFIVRFYGEKGPESSPEQPAGKTLPV